MSIICPIQQTGDVYVALSRVRDLATAMGFSPADRARIEIATTELARNLIVHAGGGRLTFSQVNDPSYGPGLVIESRDNGPGIADVELALQDGYSTAHGLGAGLPGVRRLMDAFAIESTVGVGTWIRAVKWVIRPRRSSIYGC
ncbi:MAG: anti-sigma regulatory factor [Oscillochloridaceae bacterium]|nr:anti-sigma regulatory factor [Chloroflexaceae bacterium]MDW8389736.1 anti-sigma regulatory factor [Oscillochloridaceae bacterium]